MPATSNGSVITSPKSGDFTRVQNKSKTRKTSKTDAAIHTLIDQSDECNKCSKALNDQGSIQCDRCSAWFHVSCTRLSKAHFKFLNSNPTNELLWFCDPCTKNENNQINPGVLISQQATKLEALTQIVSTLQQQNTLIIEMLNKNSNKSTDEAIQIHVSEVLHEQKEKEEKKNNIILFNLPEIGEDTENPEDLDLKNTLEVLSHVDPDIKTDALNSIRVTRLYKRKTGQDPAPRPIKITLDNPESRSKILSKAKKLKTYKKFGKLGLSADKTKKEREEYRQLKQQCEKLRGDSGKDYIIFRGKCVIRSTIPEIIKTGKSSSDSQNEGLDQSISSK